MPYASYFALRTTIMAVAFLAIVGCSNELQDYSDQMNPIFQQHVDEYSMLAESIDSLWDRLLTMSRTRVANMTTAGELIDLMAAYEKALDRYERKASVHLDQWVSLEPPKPALEFHEMTLEMMQLRYDATLSFQAELVKFNMGIREFDFDSLDAAADKFNQSDRLLVRVLAKARELER